MSPVRPPKKGDRLELEKSRPQRSVGRDAPTLAARDGIMKLLGSRKYGSRVLEAVPLPGLASGNHV